MLPMVTFLKTQTIADTKFGEIIKKKKTCQRLKIIQLLCFLESKFGKLFNKLANNF